jgi:hypothetical protein
MHPFHPTRRIGHAACFLLLAIGPTVRAQHAGDVVVGVHGPSQQLATFGYDPGANYVSLLPGSVILPGWADNNPGFDHQVTPVGDRLPMQPGATIILEILAIDPAFRVIGPPPSFVIADAAGETQSLGGHLLHVHLTWHINVNDPAYDPDQCVWHMTARLIDVGSTGYVASEPFTFAFTSIPRRAADGDFDGDGQATATDAEAFAECMDGPAARPSPDDPAITTCEVECVNAFDFDGDLDVDLSDQTAFAQHAGP